MGLMALLASSSIPLPPPWCIIRGKHHRDRVRMDIQSHVSAILLHDRLPSCVALRECVYAHSVIHA
jgi:hypothetical protein